MEEYDPNLIQALSRQKEGVDTEIKYQLDSDSIIIEIEHLLRGDYYNEEANKWINEPLNRHMNEMGIKRVASILKTYLNRNEFLTTFEDDRIMKKCLLCVDNVANLFVLEGDIYEMKEEEYDLILWEIIMPNVESAIRRATNSMTLNAHSKMQASIEHIDHSQQNMEQQQIEQQSRWKFFGG